MKSSLIVRRIGMLLGVAGLLIAPVTRIALPGLASQAAARASQATSVSSISTEHLRDHVRFLASDELQGRRAGTPEADRAAEYIAAQFKKYGLAPVAASGFLQPFTFVSGVKLGDGNYLRVKTPGATNELMLSAEYMPLAFSSPAAIKAAVVFAGYGISAAELQYDDYKAIDVRGKIVIISRGSPDGDNPHGRFADYTAPGREIEFKTLAARQKGAAGVMFISDTANFKEDPLSRLRYDLNFLDAGIPAAVISRPAAVNILSAGGIKPPATDDSAKSVVPTAVDLPGVEVQIKTNVIKLESKTSNVVGLIKGSDPVLASQYVVIGAHYDHLGMGGPESLAQNPYGQIHHGADDNASGTAAVLELARVLMLQRDQLKRSIIMASFSGEEEGLLGSAYYAKNPPVPLSSTVAMINMDMIGRLRSNMLMVSGTATSPEWKPLLEELNNGPAGHAAVGEGVASTRFKLALGDDGYGPSDHQSFYIRDIPVLFFFTGSHDDYHKPSDTADKINAEGIKQVAELVGDVAIRVADEPARIAFTKVKRESKPTSGGFRVYLGTVPNYADQTDGLKLDGVRPDSPAERAGLRAGDVVVKLGGVDVKNVYDYTYALEELKPGVEIEMVVRRDSKLMTLKITPDKRR
ncbi:MAG TPA: M28 family peptidase [Blastocatellia bacterium]|nr:M28 family peptidase [Blastocatellia bacterium]